jgi:hypothetical protein
MDNLLCPESLKESIELKSISELRTILQKEMIGYWNGPCRYVLVECKLCRSREVWLNEAKLRDKSGEPILCYYCLKATLLYALGRAAKIVRRIHKHFKLKTAAATSNLHIRRKCLLKRYKMEFYYALYKSGFPWSRMIKFSQLFYDYLSFDSLNYIQECVGLKLQELCRLSVACPYKALLPEYDVEP